MKFFNYRIELDNIFHYYYETQKGTYTNVKVIFLYE
jgi:hypothetical protein